MTGAALLEARNLTAMRGGVEVLAVPSFVLREGEVLSLIGPNGAGKSTFLLTLACLLVPTTGEVYFRGDLVSKASVKGYRRLMAMVFQEPLLFDTTVFENVAAGLKIRGLGRKEIVERVGETLDLLRITHLAGRSARKLSGGEAQRTSLARALAIRPELIFLDEPFAALDPPTRLAMTEDLERILKETETAAIVATHDQLEALRLSDQMAVMKGGRILQSGPPVGVMHRPVDEFVASFVGMENVLTGKATAQDNEIMTVLVSGEKVQVAGIASAGEGIVFCIRPEHITVSTSDPGGTTSARNVFRTTIRRIMPMGAYHKLMLEGGFSLVAYLTSQSVAALQLEVGKEVYASFKATAVHLIRTDK